jgi:uncharacterized caspase-like protein
MGDVMPRIRRLITLAFALIPLVLVFAVSAARAEKRVALVVGNAGYQVGALATPANDAGLVAQTLQAAGFDVVGARDLDQDSLRRAFRDFLDKATAAGADTVAFIYVSGYGVQLEGENYFVPVDAKIARDADVAAEAIRLSDYTRPLAALKLKASIVVLDAARANPFAKSSAPLAGGLALVEPEPGVLVAFNAAPGTVAPEGQGPYGPYAQALAEMMREGGLPLAGVFDRARLRVNDVTKGAEVPWYASKVETPLVFFERAPDAPPPAVSSEQTAAIRARPIRDLAAQEAYAAALERDTLDGYSEFITAYPDDPMAARVRAIVAARREAITWRRSRIVDTPPAYWSYLRRYPQGPHAADAHRRLAFLAAAFEPPSSFTAIAYDLPPPPPEEIVYIRRPVLIFDDPVFAFAPPPPPPVIFLAPPPPEFVVLAPPPPPVAIFVLPMPIYRPVPVWVRPPAYVAPPPNNVIYTNVHNTVVVNNVTNTVTITNPSGQTQTMAPAAAMAAAAQPTAASPQQAAPAAASPQAASAPAAPAAAPSLAPSLPPSVAQKAATLQTQSPQGGAQPSAPGSTPTQPAPQAGQPLPGMKGQPLPSPTSTPATPTAPSAAIAPGTSTPAPGSAKPGSAKPATAPSQGPAAKPATPSSPSAAITPATPSPVPAGSAKPATSPSQTPAATPKAPSAAIAPATSTPAPDGRAKRKTSPPQTPAAKLSPTTPSAAVTPAAPSPAPGAGAKPAAPPPQMPAAKPSAPTTPSAAITPGPLPANKPATPTPHVPAAKPPTPSALPAPAKPVIAAPSPPPAAITKPATPPPQIPAAHPAPPPAKPIAPAAAAAVPPTAAPKAVPPQPKGCPAGKTMAVVNGQPVCK